VLVIRATASRVNSHCSPASNLTGDAIPALWVDRGATFMGSVVSSIG